MVSNVTLLESSTQLSGRVRAGRNRCKPISRISDRSGKNGRLRVRGRRPTAASSCICDARTSPHRGRRITSDFPCRSRHWMTRGARMPFQTRIDKFEAEKKRYGAGKCQQSVRRGCLFIVHGARSKARRLSRRATPDAARHRRRICKSRYRVRLDIWTSLRGHSRVVRGCAIHALRYSVWMPCQQVNSSRDAGHQSRHEAASRRYAGCSCTFRNPHRGLFLSAIAWEGHRPVYRRFGAIALPGH